MVLTTSSTKSKLVKTDLKTHKLPDKSPTTKTERREKRENGIKNSSFFYVYCPNRWVTIAHTQYKVYFCILIPQLLKFWKNKFESAELHFLK
jgi:hypothetical protein